MLQNKSSNKMYLRIFLTLFITTSYSNGASSKVTDYDEIFRIKLWNEDPYSNSNYFAVRLPQSSEPTTEEVFTGGLTEENIFVVPYNQRKVNVRVEDLMGEMYNMFYESVSNDKRGTKTRFTRHKNKNNADKLSDGYKTSLGKNEDRLLHKIRAKKSRKNAIVKRVPRRKLKLLKIHDMPETVTWRFHGGPRISKNVVEYSDSNELANDRYVDNLNVNKESKQDESVDKSYLTSDTDAAETSKDIDLKGSSMGSLEEEIYDRFYQQPRSFRKTTGVTENSVRKKQLIHILPSDSDTVLKPNYYTDVNSQTDLGRNFESR